MFLIGYVSNYIEIKLPNIIHAIDIELKKMTTKDEMKRNEVNERANVCLKGRAKECVRESRKNEKFIQFHFVFMMCFLFSSSTR